MNQKLPNILKLQAAMLIQKLLSIIIMTMILSHTKIFSRSIDYSPMLTLKNVFKDFINLNDLIMNPLKTYIQDVFLNDGVDDDADQNVEKYSE